MSSKFFSKIKEYGVLFFVIKCGNKVCYKIIRKIYESYLIHFSKIEENKFFFYSKPSFSDNSKYLCDYIEKLGLENTRIIWALNEKDDIKNINFPKHYDSVFIRDKFNNLPLSTLKHRLTSKYVFFTHGASCQRVKIRSGQRVINLWHGCGYKDVEEMKTSWFETFPFNYALVPGSVFVKTKSKFWGCDEEKIKIFGYPRYDLLFQENQKAESFVKELRGENDRLIVWMPTLRKGANTNFPESHIEYKFDIPLLNSSEELLKLDDLCGENGITICIKRHPMQLKYSCENMDLKNIKFLSSEDISNRNVELYSFLRYTDSLLSDYSSVAIDYLLLDKPIAFALEDFNSYKNARGFVFDDPMQYMPGYHLYNLLDFENYLKDIANGEDIFKMERTKLLPSLHNPCKNYCERVWDFVKALE